MAYADRPKRLRAIDGLIRSDDKGAAFLGEIGLHLRRGKMPPFMKERERLIAEGETPEADHVIAYLRGIMQKIYHANNNGADLPAVQIYLADRSGVNVSVINQSDTPFLIFHLGFLDYLVQQGLHEDHLAAVLGHEMFHLHKSGVWDHATRNSRPEETVGDVFGVLQADKAGYNPSAAGELWESVIVEEKRLGHEGSGSIWHIVLQVFDEHPSTHDRKRNVDAAVASLQLKKRMNEAFVPLDAGIVQILPDVRHKSEVLLTLEGQGYAAASTAEKVRLLGSAMRDTCDQNENKMHTYMRKLYLHEYKECCDALLLGPKDAAAQAEAKVWFENFMMKKPAGFHYSIAHETALHIMLDLMGWHAPFKNPRKNEYRKKKSPEEAIPPEFRALEKESKRFIKARTREEAVAAAHGLREAEKTLARCEAGIGTLGLGPEEMGGWPSTVEINGNEHYEARPQRLDWESHVHWANGQGEKTEQDKADSELIRSTALALGARDDRFQDNVWHYDSKKPSYGLDQIVWDDKGFIIRIKPTQDELDALLRERMKKGKARRFKRKQASILFKTEERLQRERDEAEDVLVKTVDWSRMEKDFWSFVAEHAKHIGPALTVVPGRHPFASVFLQKLQALVQEKPDPWHQTYVTFLTGYDAEQRAEMVKTGYFGGGFTDNSLPDLIRTFRSRYSIERDRAYFRGALPDGHPMREALESLPDVRVERRETERLPNGKERIVRIPVPVVPKEEEVVKPAIRVDSGHPFLGALVDLDLQDFTIGERRYMSTLFHVLDPSAKRLETLYSIQPSVLYRYTPPTTTKGFMELHYSLKGKGESHNNSTPDEVLPYEVLRYLRAAQRKGGAPRFSFSELYYYMAASPFTVFQNRKIRKRMERELKIRVRRQMLANMRVDLGGDVPLMKIVWTYVMEHGGDIARRGAPEIVDNSFRVAPDLEKKYEAYIQKHLLALPFDERFDALDLLMTIPLRGPDFRQWAVRNWVNGAAAILGKDDGSKAYAQKANEFISGRIDYVSDWQSLSTTLSLLNKIEAQRNVSLNTKEELERKFGSNLSKGDGLMRVMDTLVGVCAHNPKLRVSFLAYISNPVSDKNSARFLDILMEEGDNSSLSDLFRLSILDHGMSPEQKVQMFGMLHDNFRSLPMLLKTIYLDRLLFPPKESVEAYSLRSRRFVFSTVLPETAQFAAETREALSVFLDVCPPELRRLSLSTLLASSMDHSQAGQLRPGQILSQVLTRMGAAGGALLQGGHSLLMGMDLSGRPALIQLRDDLKSSKVAFDEPLWFDMWERLDQIMPDFTGRIGRLLGSGSTAYVVESFQEGQPAALKIMREGVLEQGEMQLERFGEAFKILAARHSHYEALPGLVDQASRMLKAACDGRILAAQIGYACKSYNPLQVKVGPHTVRFRVAQALSCGKDYVASELLKGPHFNDLKAEHPIASGLRTLAGIGLEAAESHHLLASGCVDEDKHGGQCRVLVRGNGNGKEVLLQLMDFGALPYDVEAQKVKVPTSAEKQALGRYLGTIINEAVAGKSPLAMLQKPITTQEWGQNADYITGIKRSLLGRMDSAMALGASDQERDATRTEILAALWGMRIIDPQIKKGMEKALSMKTKLSLLAGALGGKSSRLGIEIVSRGSFPQPRLLEAGQAVSL